MYLNKVTVFGHADVKSKVGSEESVFDFRRIIPVPQYDCGISGIEGEVIRAHYGADDNGALRVAHWGSATNSKCAKILEEDDDHIVFSFESDGIPYQVCAALMHVFWDCIVVWNACDTDFCKHEHPSEKLWFLVSDKVRADFDRYFYVGEQAAYRKDKAKNS
jgi:hypothetical protein